MTILHDDDTLALDDQALQQLDRWWRAANYLTVGQIYLRDNVLLRDPLRPEHVKPRLLGHWGTSPGLSLLWAHLNRAIVERDLEMLFVHRPGHGGPAVVGQRLRPGRAMLARHELYIVEHLKDLPEVRDWTWEP